MALTDTAIKQAKPASKPYTLTDGDGLSLQVPTTGSKRWVQGHWLKRVLSGYFNYHAVPGNLIRLCGFRLAVCRLCRQALKRRSQRNRLQWSRYGRRAYLYMPRPRNAHPYPEDRFASHTRDRSRMR
ncbi:Arm DNA-binding domain-containing protein [Pseudomonas sp. XS1P51]